MDAVEYVKELRRLCKMQKICNGCPLRNNGTCIAGLCDDGLCNEAEKAVQIVEKWAKDNPVKTRKSEFLKKFPNADMQRISTLFPCVMDQTIRPTRCVKYESFSSPKKCVECRNDYWHEEVEPNGRS